MEISVASCEDLATVLDWAAVEGWNPGLDDAAAFHAADPEGFLIGRLDGTPVTAISVVRQGPSHAFLGLFITRPEHRGKGYGQRIWDDGMARMVGRTVGLDGVEAQQGRYRAQGFETAFTTTRCGGTLRLADEDAMPGLTPLAHHHIGPLLAMDREAMGHDRRDYLCPWLSASPTRKTYVLEQGSAIRGAGTIRRCREGAKVGPLLAGDVDTALAVLKGICRVENLPRVFIDIPDAQTAFHGHVRALGLQPVFRTARMYHGVPPRLQLDRIFGLTTLELG